MHREAMERRRRAIGAEPGEDGCFTLPDFLRIAHGDREAEATGKLAAERREIEMRVECRQGELIPTAVVETIGAKYLIAARQLILASSMDAAEKDEVLAEFVALGEMDWRDEAKNAARRSR